MISTHYLPVYQPHPTNPVLIGYNVWAYTFHPLLGQIPGTLQFFRVKRQALKYAKQLRDFYNGKPK